MLDSLTLRPLTLSDTQLARSHKGCPWGAIVPETSAVRWPRARSPAPQTLFCPVSLPNSPRSLIAAQSRYSSGGVENALLGNRLAHLGSLHRGQLLPVNLGLCRPGIDSLAALIRLSGSALWQPPLVGKHLSDLVGSIEGNELLSAEINLLSDQ